MVNWCSQQPDHRLERRFVRGVGMRPGGNEHLRSAKRLGQALALFGGDCVLQLDKVNGLFFLDVLLEVCHHRLEDRHEGCVGGVHVLEFLKLFFDLQSSQ